MPLHSYRQPISALGSFSRRYVNTVGKIPSAFFTAGSRSGFSEQHSQNPCCSGPTPVNMASQLVALWEGSTVRFFNVQAPSAIIFLTFCMSDCSTL